MTKLSSITVLGTGVLGSQIAFQTAYRGFDVVAYDINDDVLEAAKKRFASLAATYRREVEPTGGGNAGGGNADGGDAEGGDADTAADAALARIRYSSDLADAVANADLVIEAIPEILQLKRDTYAQLGALAPQKTIFATNSSSLLPSSLKESTGRPDRFLALHFANRIWVNNTAEVMPTTDTDPEVFTTVVQFARDIGMVPIELKKEKAGYVLNSLLIPLLDAAAGLLVGGIADVETIDLTWRRGTGAPYGPFQIFDVVGLETAYNISAAGDPTHQAFATLLKEQYIDQGKLGVATGEGFYRYG